MYPVPTLCARFVYFTQFSNCIQCYFQYFTSSLCHYLQQRRLELIWNITLKSVLLVKINIAKNQNIDISFKANDILEKVSVSKIIFLRIFSIFLITPQLDSATQ